MGKEHLELKHPAEFQKWKKWFQHYLYSKGLEVHLTSTQPPTEDNAHERNLSLRNQAQVMAVIYKCIDSKFNNLIVGKNSPEVILKSLEVTFNASRFQEVEIVDKKFESLKYSNDPNKLYPYFRGLINKYEDVEGKLTDHHVSKKLLHAIPENNYYIPVKLQIMQEAKLNSGEYKIESVIERLKETHRKQNKGRPLRVSPNTFRNNNFQNNVKTAFKSSSRPFGVCKNCGLKGHFAKPCRNQKKEGNFCCICGNDSHLANECNQRTRKNNVSNQTLEMRQWATHLSCNKTMTKRIL